MQITTNYTDERAPFRKLSVAAVQDAMNRLTNKSLKKWLLLAMNKNGYSANVDIARSEYDELSPWLFKKPDGTYIFSATGMIDDTFTDVAGQEQSDLPYEWRMIADDYGRYGKVYYGRIVQKLRNWSLGDYVEDILTYWHDNIDDVRSRRSEYEQKTGKEVKSPLDYDVKIAAVRWAQDNFRFEVGDCFDLGTNYANLRVRDTRMMRDVQMMINRQNGNTKITVSENDRKFWNDYFSHDGFELPVEVYGQMLKERNTPTVRTHGQSKTPQQVAAKEGPVSFAEDNGDDHEIPF